MMKNPNPGRWQTLCFDEKPEHLKLWMEKHQYWMHRLEEFEGDEMWDYEGWDFLHEENDPEEEIAWRTIKKKPAKSPKSSGAKKPKTKKVKKKKTA